MEMKFSKSIGFKMAVAMAAGLLAVIGIFFYANVRMTENRLLKMSEVEASKMSDAIKSGLENAMISGDSARIQAVVDAIGQEAMIEDIKIMGITGEVKWAKNKAEIGRVIDRSTEKSCAFCHVPYSGQTKKDNHTAIFEKEKGRRILRNANPIGNHAECHSCHNPQSKILGKLLVDFSIKDADNAVSENKKMLAVSAVASLLAAVLLVMVIFTKFVKDPLQGLLTKMKEVEKENRIAIPSSGDNDEIGMLEDEFKGMMAAVNAGNRKIKEQMSEHLALFNIADILDRSGSVEEASELVLDALNIGFSVDECTIMSLKEIGRAHLNGAIGLSEEKVEAVKNYLDNVLTNSPDTGDDQLSIKNKITGGEPFVIDKGIAGMGAFMVVPLKASGRLVGVITIHKIRGKGINEIEDIGEFRRLFLIVSAQVSPYMFIGLCMDEKRAMKVSPFSCFLDLISEHIEKVREYSGYVSLAVIKVENYNDLCRDLGVDKASLRVQEAGSSISSAIDVVHDATRITEIKMVVILPMKDKFEAGDIIEKAVGSAGQDVRLKYKIVSYPDEGETPIQLMYLAYV